MSANTATPDRSGRDPKGCGPIQLRAAYHAPEASQDPWTSFRGAPHANYRVNLENRRERSTELDRDGYDSLSEYDRTIAFQNRTPEEAVGITRYLVINQIAFYERELLDGPELAQQITLFEAPDAHLEAQYENQQSGDGEEKGPRPEGGTASPEASPPRR